MKLINTGVIEPLNWSAESELVEHTDESVEAAILTLPQRLSSYQNNELCISSIRSPLSEFRLEAFWW